MILVFLLASSGRKSSLLRKQLQSQSSDSAFTLVELLVVSVLSLVLIIAFGEFLVSYLRGAATLKSSQAVRNDASRLEYLLENEVSESESIQYSSVTMPANHCPGVASTSAYFSFSIPTNLLTSNPLDRSQDDKTYFYDQGGDLYRCGRPYYRNGTLDFVGPRIAARVLQSATLDTSVTCQGRSTSGGQLVYQAIFRRSDGSPAAYQPGCSILKAKSFFVRDNGAIVPPP